MVAIEAGALAMLRSDEAPWESRMGGFVAAKVSSVTAYYIFPLFVVKPLRSWECRMGGFVAAKVRTPYPPTLHGAGG